jgi:hypothetical protein
MDVKGDYETRGYALVEKLFPSEVMHALLKRIERRSRSVRSPLPRLFHAQAPI